MVNFGDTSQQKNAGQNFRRSGTGNITVENDLATAEYSVFHIHQIKAWSTWSITQEEVSYIVDSPCSLNAARLADV